MEESKALFCHNFLSVRQYCALLFISCIPFLVAMLPSYINAENGNDSIFVGMALALINTLITCCCFWVSKNGGLIKLYQNSLGVAKAAIGCAIAFIVILSFAKLIIGLTEFLNYSSTALFEDDHWLIPTLILLPAIGYFCTKPTYNMGRIAELCLWLIGITTVFSIVFNTAKFKPINLRPVLTEGAGTVLNDSLKYLWWTGFSLPLMLSDIKKSKNDTAFRSVYITAAAQFLVVSAYFVLLQLIYGNALKQVPNTFSRVAIFNRIAEELGSQEWPIIITWLVMSFLTMVLQSKGVTEPLCLLLKKRYLAICIGLGAALIVILFVVKSILYQQTLLIESPCSYIAWLVPILSIVTAIAVCTAGKAKEKRHFNEAEEK